jgi:hypothetical protein
MGMLDASLQFSAAQAITVTAQSTNFYDALTGQSLTTTFTPTPTGAIWPVNETYFGEDLGIGKGAGTPRILVEVGTAFATLTSLQIQFQGAPLNNTAFGNGLRSSLTFVTYIQTDTIALSLLTANTRIASFDWPMRKAPATIALPRFYQLNYVVAGSTETTGTVNADVTLGDEDAQATLQQYGSNYHVAA